MTRYATLTKYQPYIDVIRKDLKIPDDVYVEVKFANLRGSKEGDCTYYHKRYLEVRVSKFLSHKNILGVLMHEFRHVYQRINNQLVFVKRGKELWNNKEFAQYSARKNWNGYYNAPWEVDARFYEDYHTALFPNGELPPQRKLIGVVGRVKFYKIGA